MSRSRQRSQFMSRKLFVGNFPFETGDAELQDLFARKQVLEFRVPGFERKVPHKQLATHELTPLSRTRHRRRLGGARSSTAAMYPWTGFRPVARQNARRSETRRGSLRPTGGT